MRGEGYPGTTGISKHKREVNKRSDDSEIMENAEAMDKTNRNGN